MKTTQLQLVSKGRLRKKQKCDWCGGTSTRLKDKFVTISSQASGLRRLHLILCDDCFTRSCQ